VSDQPPKLIDHFQQCITAVQEGVVPAPISGFFLAVRGEHEGVEALLTITTALGAGFQSGTRRILRLWGCAKGNWLGNLPAQSGEGVKSATQGVKVDIYQPPVFDRYAEAVARFGNVAGIRVVVVMRKHIVPRRPARAKAA
jgi:hypothetical protein